MDENNESKKIQPLFPLVCTLKYFIITLNYRMSYQFDYKNLINCPIIIQILLIFCLNTLWLFTKHVNKKSQHRGKTASLHRVNKECKPFTQCFNPQRLQLMKLIQHLKSKTSTIMCDLGVQRHASAAFIPLIQLSMAKHDYPFEAGWS